MRSIFTSVLLFSCFVSFSQESKQLEDILGVKVGLIGAWVHYEKAFTNEFSVDTEIGYRGGLLQGTRDKLDYVFTTSIKVEPRYYYNITDRQRKGKTTKLNAANYLALELYYVPDFLTSTNRDNVSIVKTFSLIPKYGLRRYLTHNLAFEFAFGFGYSWGQHNINGAAVALDLKFDLKL